MASKILLAVLLTLGHSPVTFQLRLKKKQHQPPLWWKGPLTTIYFSQLRGGHVTSEPESLEQPADSSLDNIIGNGGGHITSQPESLEQPADSSLDNIIGSSIDSSLDNISNGHINSQPESLEQPADNSLDNIIGNGGGHITSQPESLEQPADSSLDNIIGKCSSPADCQKIMDKLAKPISRNGLFDNMSPVDATSLAYLFVGILTEWFTEDICFDASTRMAKAHFENFEETQHVPLMQQSADKVFGERLELTFSEFAESFLHQEELRAIPFMLSCPLRSRLLHMYAGLLRGDTSSQPQSLEQLAESPLDKAIGNCSLPGDCQRVIDELASSLVSDGEFGNARSADATSLAYLFVGILTKQFTEDISFDASTKMTKAQFVAYKEKQHDSPIVQSSDKVFVEHSEMSFREFADSFLNQEELRARLFILSSPLRSRLLSMCAGSSRSDTSSQPENLEQPAEAPIDNTIGKSSSPGDCLKVIDKLATLISSDGQFGGARSADATALAYLFVGILTEWFSEDILFDASTKMTKAQLDNYEEKSPVGKWYRSADKVFGERPEMTFSEFAESFLNQEGLQAMPLMLSYPLRDRLSHMRGGTQAWLSSYTKG